MSVEKVKIFFEPYGMAPKVMEFETSSATVELAAKALNVIPARIAKTLSFKAKEGEGCFLVVAAGDAKIDNPKFKAAFSTKAKMLTAEEVVALTGHPVGGVCPFGIPQNIPVYLDVSLKRFETVFPACGSDNSAIELTCGELTEYSRAADWVDICKDWDSELR